MPPAAHQIDRAHSVPLTACPIPELSLCTMRLRSLLPCVPFGSDSQGGRGCPDQLVELAEHFVHDGFHFCADDGQSEHGLGGFTEVSQSAGEGHRRPFSARGWGSLAHWDCKSAEFGGDVFQFRESCVALASSLMEATLSVASLIKPVASLMSFVPSS